ncbi:MAG: ABC transporter ATPase [Sphingobacteriales bacterium]|nr:MAG: ABC transporter ATPase [Sphingobacteriales bacterium]TAF82536.1 MAG: ABC transporter ATPase [Sphingobacteriales bacterium]
MLNNPNTKVWIYQSNKLLIKQQVTEIEKILTNFTLNWQAHGQPLSAGFELKYNLFIVLWVDEKLAQASGCSIDALVRVIKEIDQKFNLDLFNRFNMAWLQNGILKFSNKENFAQLVLNKTIQADTLVFNNMVQTAYQYINEWKIPFAQSWHSKVFAIV